MNVPNKLECLPLAGFSKLI